MAERDQATLIFSTTRGMATTNYRMKKLIKATSPFTAAEFAAFEHGVWW
jgi:hypothetical protein